MQKATRKWMYRKRYKGLSSHHLVFLCWFFFGFLLCPMMLLHHNAMLPHHLT